MTKRAEAGEGPERRARGSRRPAATPSPQPEALAEKPKSWRTKKPGIAGLVNAMVFLPDARLVAVGYFYDKQVSDRGQVGCEYQDLPFARSFDVRALENGAKVVVAGEEGRLALIDPISGRLLQLGQLQQGESLAGQPTVSVLRVRPGQGGRRLAVVADSGELCLASAKTLQPIKSHRCAELLRGVAWLSREQIVVCGARGVQVFAAETLEPQARADLGPTFDLDASADGQTIVVGAERGLLILDRRLELRAELTVQGATRVSFAPDGLTAFATVPEGPHKGIWRVATAAAELFPVEMPGKEALHALAFHPRTGALYAGGAGAVYYWPQTAGVASTAARQQAAAVEEAQPGPAAADPLVEALTGAPGEKEAISPEAFFERRLLDGLLRERIIARRARKQATSAAVEELLALELPDSARRWLQLVECYRLAPSGRVFGQWKEWIPPLLPRADKGNLFEQVLRVAGGHALRHHLCNAFELGRAPNGDEYLLHIDPYGAHHEVLWWAADGGDLWAVADSLVSFVYLNALDELRQRGLEQRLLRARAKAIARKVCLERHFEGLVSYVGKASHKGRSQVEAFARRSSWVVELLGGDGDLDRAVELFRRHAASTRLLTKLWKQPQLHDAPAEALYWLWHLYWIGGKPDRLHKLMALTDQSRSPLVRDATKLIAALVEGQLLHLGPVRNVEARRRAFNERRRGKRAGR